MIAEGYNGRMELHDGAVVITRKLFFGRSKGAKSIVVNSISAVQFKPCGLTAGYLQLAFSGSKESKGGLMDAASDENTIMFYKKAQPQFEALRDEIERQRARPAQASQTVAEQIAAFARLRDEGILTQEEFDAKKRQLLGL